MDALARTIFLLGYTTILVGIWSVVKHPVAVFCIGYGILFTLGGYALLGHVATLKRTHNGDTEHRA